MFNLSNANNMSEISDENLEKDNSEVESKNEKNIDNQPQQKEFITKKSTHLSGLHSHLSLESFGYFFMFITLYLVAAAIGMILHYHAENFFPAIGTISRESSGFPDVFSYLILEMVGSGYGVISPIIPHIATLIVVYPFFAFLFLWVTNRKYKDSSVRNLKSRKYFLYVTLVLTFLFMLFKIITLVMNLLTGNGTMNFISHFLITVGINATIFAYCVYELWEDKKYDA
jgi:hypothetical protein